MRRQHGQVRIDRRHDEGDGVFGDGAQQVGDVVRIIDGVCANPDVREHEGGRERVHISGDDLAVCRVYRLCEQSHERRPSAGRGDEHIGGAATTDGVQLLAP